MDSDPSTFRFILPFDCYLYSMDNYFQLSPLQRIEDDLLRKKKIELFVKRDDLLHSEVQGNKWRKLKYNLEQARLTGQTTLLTFGGAYSNHIYATAAAASLGFKTIGVIRGKESSVLSPTLQFALSKGMKLHFLSREDYRLKYEESGLNKLKNKFGDFYLVPEGGTNIHALKGVAEIIDELDIEFDYLCTAVGTGGTLAGLVAALKGQKQAIGFSSLKGDDTLTATVHKLVSEFSDGNYNHFSINFDYHFGGYARVKPDLIDFIKYFKYRYGIPLEPVYTGKMFYGIFDLIKKDYFPPGSRIIALHTGGLQGLRGFSNYFSESELSTMF